MKGSYESHDLRSIHQYQTQLWAGWNPIMPNNSQMIQLNATQIAEQGKKF